MRKIIFIFVLLSCNSEKMTVSEALPIKFWPLGDDTYNEKVVGFVDLQCHFQEFSCIDPIKLQVTDTDFNNDYDLRIEDKDGNNILIEPFIKSYTPYQKIVPPLSFSDDFLTTLTLNQYNQGLTGQVPFTWFSSSKIRCNVTVGSPFYTELLLIPRPTSSWPPGNYTVRLKGDNSSAVTGGLSTFIYSRNGGVPISQTLTVDNTPVSGATFDYTVSFTLSDYYSEIAVGWRGFAALDLRVDLIQFTQLPLTESLSVFDLDFTALSLSETFCDQYVRFYIQQNGTDAYKSDLIKFNSSIALNQGYGTILISYKSSKNFAGIVYPNDGNYFNIRVPARFFQARNKGTETSIELSNSKVINTSSSLKKQVLLSTILLPDYLHDIIELALAHSVSGLVSIDGYDWIKEEGYERNLPDTKCPKQSGKVWLTRKNHVVRNII